MGEKATPARVHLSRCCLLWRIERFCVPTCGWYKRYAINSIREHLPESFWILGPWKTATKTDDRNGIRPCSLVGFLQRRATLHRQIRVRQITGESIERRIIIDQCRRERTPQP